MFIKLCPKINFWPIFLTIRLKKISQKFGNVRTILLHPMVRLYKNSQNLFYFSCKNRNRKPEIQIVLFFFSRYLWPMELGTEIYQMTMLTMKLKIILPVLVRYLLIRRKSSANSSSYFFHFDRNFCQKVHRGQKIVYLAILCLELWIFSQRS